MAVGRAAVCLGDVAGGGWQSSFSPHPWPIAERVVWDPALGPQGWARCGSRPARAHSLAAHQKGPFPEPSRPMLRVRALAVPAPPRLGVGTGLFLCTHCGTGSCSTHLGCCGFTHTFLQTCPGPEASLQPFSWPWAGVQQSAGDRWKPGDPRGVAHSEPSSWGQVSLVNGSPFSGDLAIWPLPVLPSGAYCLLPHSCHRLTPGGPVEARCHAFQRVSLHGCPTMSLVGGVCSALHHWPGLLPFPERLVLTPWASPSMLNPWASPSMGRRAGH